MNYGWNRFEGDLCHRENEFVNAELGDCSGADWSSYKHPHFQYCHADYDSKSDDSKYTGGEDVCGDRAVTGKAIIGKPLTSSVNKNACAVIVEFALQMPLFVGFEDCVTRYNSMRSLCLLLVSRHAVAIPYCTHSSVIS